MVHHPVNFDRGPEIMSSAYLLRAQAAAVIFILELGLFHLCKNMQLDWFSLDEGGPVRKLTALKAQKTLFVTQKKLYVRALPSPTASASTLSASTALTMEALDDL